MSGNGEGKRPAHRPLFLSLSVCVCACACSAHTLPALVSAFTLHSVVQVCLFVSSIASEHLPSIAEHFHRSLSPPPLSLSPSLLALPRFLCRSPAAAAQLLSTASASVSVGCSRTTGGSLSPAPRPYLSSSVPPLTDDSVALCGPLSLLCAGRRLRHLRQRGDVAVFHPRVERARASLQQRRQRLRVGVASFGRQLGGGQQPPRGPHHLVFKSEGHRQRETERKREK